MIGYISIGSYRIKGDDWQSHPLREVVSTVPLYEFRPITSIHHIMGAVKSAPHNPYFVPSALSGYDRLGFNHISKSCPYR